MTSPVRRSFAIPGPSLQGFTDKLGFLGPKADESFALDRGCAPRPDPRRDGSSAATQ